MWLAHETYGDAALRTVALKLVSIGAGEGARDAVIREARALCQVEHPNVVRFLALAEDRAKGRLGLVMQHLSGTPLHRKLEAAGGKLGQEAVVEIGRSIAAALAAVHGAGLLHRDVKPANVMEEAGAYKLIDFGVAGLVAPAPPAPREAEPEIVDDLPLDPPSERPSIGETLAGTPGYVDPICVRTGQPATAASDLYGLGATLYECLTGAVPAVRASIARGEGGPRAAVLEGREAPPKIADAAPEVSPALAKLVDALVAPEAEDRPRTAEIVLWELERIRREIGGHPRSLPSEDVGPFRGLDRFEAADRDVYLGRTAEIAAALDMLRTRAVVTLIGPSGSGKSSLARAGVVPAVTDGELGGWPAAWDAVVVAPGAEPEHAIRSSLASFLEGGADLDADGVADTLAERAVEKGRGTLLVLDPLEEIVTVASAEGRAFVEKLLARIGHAPHPGVRALVTVRRDLFDRVLALGEIARLLTRGTILVEALSPSTWLDVVEQSIERYGYRLESVALRGALQKEIAEISSAMPLIQFALLRLWQERDRDKKVIRKASLEKIGGLAGGLEQHADATLERIWSIDARAPDVAKQILLAHTTPEGTRVSRRRAELAELVPSDLTERVVTELAKARLLVREEGQSHLSHEALLTQWGTLRALLAEARADRSLAEEIEREAEAWVARPDRERLWKGRRLAAAEQLAKKRGAAELTPGARSFVRAARSAERKGRVTLLSAGLVVAAAAAVGGGAYVRALVVHERLEADRARALSREATAAQGRAEAQASASAAAARSQADLAASATARASRAEERAKESDLTAESARRERDKAVKDLEQLKKRIPKGAVEIGPIEKPGRP